MSYSNACRMQFETLRSVAFGSITNAFLPLGTPYDNPIRILKVVNDTDGLIQLSFDGVNAHDVYAPTSGGVYDFSTNRAANAEEAEQPKHTQVYIKYTIAPTAGTFYVVVVYANSF